MMADDSCICGLFDPRCRYDTSNVIKIIKDLSFSSLYIEPVGLEVSLWPVQHVKGLAGGETTCSVCCEPDGVALAFNVGYLVSLDGPASLVICWLFVSSTLRGRDHVHCKVELL
jgi:hypothetical protein